MNVIKNANFQTGLKNHQIKTVHGFAQNVMLLHSDNKYFNYPVTGVLIVQEQGIDLSIICAVFHHQAKDGSLGAPAVVKNPIFKTI